MCDKVKLFEKLDESSLKGVDVMRETINPNEIIVRVAVIMKAIPAKIKGGSFGPRICNSYRAGKARGI